MRGVVEGGWEFVVAAYTVSAVVLLGYVLSVIARYRSESDRAAREGRGEQL